MRGDGDSAPPPELPGAPAAGSGGPATVDSLTADLRDLGVTAGACLLVHTSLSALGWVVGGEHAVVLALRRAIDPDGRGEGTLVMPAQSWQLCDPAYLNNPAVPREWWSAIRAHLPAWDPASTPTRTMGAVAELFRTLPGVRRSDHPHRSCAAEGRHAERVVARHDLTSPVGEGSPLRALYDLGADAAVAVLLLGVGHEKSTALHLAEDRCDYAGRHSVRNGAPLLVDGLDGPDGRARPRVGGVRGALARRRGLRRRWRRIRDGGRPGAARARRSRRCCAAPAAGLCGLRRRLVPAAPCGAGSRRGHDRLVRGRPRPTPLAYSASRYTWMNRV